MLVYTGMAADILEIFEAFRENKVNSDGDDDDGGDGGGVDDDIIVQDVPQKQGQL